MMLVSDSDVRPMSLRAFAWLYSFDGEWRRTGPQSCEFIQPVMLDLPPDARPRFSSHGRSAFSRNSSLYFYDHTGNKRLADGIQCYDIGFPETLLLAPDGTWWQVSGGRAEYRGGRWCVIYEGWRNTRLALMANAGFWAYREAVAPHPLRIWLDTWRRRWWRLKLRVSRSRILRWRATR